MRFPTEGTGTMTVRVHVTESRSSSLLERRLHFVTGKGGVGKSTFAASLAFDLARRGKRPLVVELGHRASLRAIFGRDVLGYAATEVAPGVHALNLDEGNALLDYVSAHVRVRSLAKRILASAPLQAFSQAAPAVHELAALDRIAALLREPAIGRAKSGSPSFRWDPIIVDLDATGHALMFLELPRVLGRLVERGPLASELDQLSRVLGDVATTCLHVVTLPGELPLRETEELYARLVASDRVPLGALIVNRIAASPFSPGNRTRAVEIARRAEPDLARDLALAIRADDACTAAHMRIDALRRKVALPFVALPEIDGGASHMETLSKLGAIAADALARAS